MKVVFLALVLSSTACATTWAPEKKGEIMAQCKLELRAVGAPAEIGEDFCGCLVPKVEAAVKDPTEANIRAFMQSPEGDAAAKFCAEATKKKFGI